MVWERKMKNLALEAKRSYTSTALAVTFFKLNRLKCCHILISKPTNRRGK